jgi:hypothetical protein
MIAKNQAAVNRTLKAFFSWHEREGYTSDKPCPRNPNCKSWATTSPNKFRVTTWHLVGSIREDIKF